MKITHYFFLFLCIVPLHAVDLLSFNQVIIWGYKLHSHTHSYIHYAFDKTFRHLGYKTYWLDDNDNTQSFNFSNSLFITMGDEANKKMPLRDDCTYIIHNCDTQRFKSFLDQGNCIQLQVYTHDALKNHSDLVKIDECMYYSLLDKVIYLPWATDALPHEIDLYKKQTILHKNKNSVMYIGTIWDGYFGNLHEIEAFKRASRANKKSFENIRNMSEEDSVKLIKNAFMAPSIQGKWQCSNGYIPCRIFKNISYGTWGITNSETVYNLFKQKITYNPDCYQLYFDAKKKIKSLKIDELHELMDFVKEKHTYVNRIDELFKFILRVKNNTSK